MTSKHAPADHVLAQSILVEEISHEVRRGKPLDPVAFVTELLNLVTNGRTRCTQIAFADEMITKHEAAARRHECPDSQRSRLLRQGWIMIKTELFAHDYLMTRWGQHTADDARQISASRQEARRLAIQAFEAAGVKLVSKAL